MITRIMSATHARVSKRDEATLADLEKENALLVENQSKEVSPTETFDVKLAPLKLLADRNHGHRIEGAP